MFKLCFALWIVLVSMHVHAQEFSISGSVRDGKTNQSLPGATVQVGDLNRFAVTNEQGEFSLEKIPAGDHTLLVKFLGYAEKSQAVTVDDHTTVTVLMEEVIRMTDEVVVYATRATEKTPATYSTISREKIEEQNFGQDLPFLLNWTPSVVTTSDAGSGLGYTGIRIRGSDATRINVTINGIPYNDSESLGTFWVNVPDIASSSESIQIQRGVGTSTNGAGAFGATINLQTNSRKDKPYAEVVNAYGSFDTRRHTVNFGTGMLNDHWVIDGRVSKISSDGFIDRATVDLQSYYLSAGFYTDKTLIKAIAFGGKERTYQSWYGVPESRLNDDYEAMMITAMNEGWNEEQTQNLLNSGSRTFNPYLYENQVDDYHQNNYQLHFSQRFGDALTANLAFHYTPGEGFYEEYRYNDAFENYSIPPVVIGDSTIESTDLIRRRWLDNQFYGLTYSVSYEREGWNTVLGGGWNRYDGDHFGELIWAEISPVPAEYRYYFNNGDKRDFNIFTKTNYQLSERLSAYVDLQYRKIMYKTSGIENGGNEIGVDTDFDFFNPKAGLVYALSDRQQVYASYSVANREPVRNDFVDAVPGRTPQHETLYNVEAGYRVVHGRYTLNINYYLMDYKNQLVLTGQLNDVGASIRTNVDESYRTGLEVEGAVKFTDNIIWNANFSVSQNKIRNFEEVLYDYGTNYDEYNELKRTYKNTDISFSPDLIAGSGLTFKPFKNFDATILTKYVGRQFMDNTSNKDRSLDPYIINDIRLTYSIHPSFMKEISMSFLLNNVLDERYESNGFTYGYLGGGTEFRENFYYPQAGRNFLAMLAFKF